MTGRLEFRPHEDGTDILRNGEKVGYITPKAKTGFWRGLHTLSIRGKPTGPPHDTLDKAKQAARQLLGD